MSIKRSQISPELYNKNWLINSDMNISQRGDFTSATAVVTGTYFVDRIKNDFAGALAPDVQHITSSQPSALSGTKSLKLTATASATGRLRHNQYVEDFNSLAGKEVTFSAYVKSNTSNARIGTYKGDAHLQGQAHSGGGGWERLSMTFTVASSLTSFQLYCVVGGDPWSTIAITSGQYIEITGVKLEVGSTATDYELSRRSLGEELILCQRYYRKSYNITTAPGTSTFLGTIKGWGANASSAIIGASTSFLPMRATPTVVFYDQVGNSNRVSCQTGGGSQTDNLTINSSSLSQQEVSTRTFQGTAYAQLMFHYTADAEL